MLSTIEDRFRFLILRYNVDVRAGQPIKSASHLTIFHSHTVLSIREGLHGPEMFEAAAVQFGRMVLGHAFRRSAWQDLRSDRREWRQALRWAAEMLIPDHAMEMAAREDWTVWELAEECQVTERLVAVRALAWANCRHQIAQIRPFFGNMREDAVF